jgi:hypothetical protein
MGSTKEWNDFDHNHTQYEPQLVSVTAGMGHSWYIMNRSWRSLRLELTIILNLEDLLKPIELDQKPRE